MEFLIEYRLLGLFIGVCTFLIIGLFHPVVVKAEYYWGTRCWWVFLLLGLGGMAVSLLTDNVLLAALAGVFAFSVVMDDQGTVRAARAGGQGLVSRQSEKEGKEIVNAGGATGMPVYGFPFLRRKEMAAPWQNGYSLFLLATNLISNPVVKVTPIKHQIHHLESENIRESILVLQSILAK